MGFEVCFLQLKLRMERGVGPFTVLSCDNIPDNGHKTQALILTLAKHYDPALAKWIEDNVPFPMTMVRDKSAFEGGPNLQDLNSAEYCCPYNRCSPTYHA